MENLPPIPPLPAPPAYQVYCCVWVQGLDKWRWHRVGARRSLDQAKQLIGDDAANFFAMRPKPRDEHGNSKPYARVYRIFAAPAEFVQVGDDQIYIR